jgi:hypothetical protein
VQCSQATRTNNQTSVIVGQIVLPSEADYMPGYQKQSGEVLQDMINQFNQSEHIHIMSDLFSKMLVISAENNFEHKKTETNIW